MKVLLIIYEYQIKNESSCFCPLSQQEIADLVPCSKLKVNQILRELIKEGYVEMLRCRGRYVLSKKGIKIINKLM
jgi:predicted transcriptional regulator